MKKIILILCFLFSNFSYSQVTFNDVGPALGVADPGNGQGTVFFDFK